MTPTINNPATLGAVVVDVAAIKAVTDAIPDSGAMSSVIAQRVAAGGLVPLPETGGHEFNLADGTPGNTYGTEVEIDPVAAEDMLIEGMYVTVAAAVSGMVVRFSIGGAGSEVPRVEIPFTANTENLHHTIPFPRSFKFANGERLTAALRSGGTTATAIVGVLASKMSALEPENG